MIKNIIKNKNFILFIIFCPILFNFFYNLLNLGIQINEVTSFKTINFLISVIFFTSFFFLGKIIKVIFNFQTISFGIVLFLLSFFIIDKTFLILSKNILFKDLFVITVFLWFVIFAKNIRKIKKIDFTSLIISYGFGFYLLKILNRNITLSTSDFRTSDEKYFWYPNSVNIYEINYFDSLLNNILSSYGLLVAHVHSVLSYLFTLSENFLYFPAYKNIFFLFTLLFIYELKAKNNAKIIFGFFFSIICLTSDWFNYLFFNSILAESVSSYFFGIIIYEILENYKNRTNITIHYFCLGYLYFSKQFLSVFSLIFGIYIIFKNKEKIIHYYLLFFGFLVDLINSYIIETPITWTMYLNNIDTAEANTFDGIKAENIFNIINQFLIDKPVSYFIFVIVVLTLYLTLFKKLKINDLYILIILFNTVFVFLLYIFIWTNVEYESSYRYLLNVLHIIIVYSLNIFDNFLEKEK